MVEWWAGRCGTSARPRTAPLSPSSPSSSPAGLSYVTPITALRAPTASALLVLVGLWCRDIGSGGTNDAERVREHAGALRPKSPRLEGRGTDDQNSNQLPTSAQTIVLSMSTDRLLLELISF